jgi:hypothetical protein
MTDKFDHAAYERSWQYSMLIDEVKALAHLSQQRHNGLLVGYLLEYLAHKDVQFVLPIDVEKFREELADAAPGPLGDPP